MNTTTTLLAPNFAGQGTIILAISRATPMVIKFVCTDGWGKSVTLPFVVKDAMPFTDRVTDQESATVPLDGKVNCAINASLTQAVNMDLAMDPPGSATVTSIGEVCCVTKI